MNVRPTIQFQIRGSDFMSMEVAAAKVAIRFFDTDKIRVASRLFVAEETTIENVVLVWCGTYTAEKEI